MAGETPFRIAFAALFLTVLIIAGNYRIRARAARGTVSGKAEGGLLFALLRLGGFAVWVSLLAYMFNPRWMAWSQLPLPAWLRWTGAASVALMIPLVFATYRAIGTNITHTVVTREGHQLVTSGPYRYIRHPLYTAGFLSFVGFGLLAANWFMLAGAFAAIVLITIRLPKEEARLIETFGDEYRDYMRRTGRYFPWLVG